jgi:hypothetical protein
MADSLKHLQEEAEEDQDPGAWLRLVGNCSREGLNWVNGYIQAGGVEVTNLIDRAVGFLRCRDIHNGAALLAQAATHIKLAATQATSSGTLALERWYWSALAYSYYCQEDFPASIHSLDNALQSVRLAISESRFLILLAHHCYDFQLQYAKVLRYQYRWKCMKRHIELGRAMLAGQAPLCTLEDGTSVFTPDIYNYYRRDSHNREWHSSSKGAHLLGRKRAYEKLAKETLIIPGFVIPYP